MNLETKLESLQKRHKQLDENISRGYTNYISDSNLCKMKQEKLMIKRQIESIKAQLGL